MTDFKSNQNPACSRRGFNRPPG